METDQQKSSEVIIPVLEHCRLHFGSGRVSDLNIMITIGISPRASIGPTKTCALETHHEKWSEVGLIIPVLQHVHVVSGRDSVRKIMIKQPN